MFAMRACRKSTMVCKPLNAEQMTTKSRVPSPCYSCCPLSRGIVRWPSDDEAPAQRGHVGEEGAELHGLDRVCAGVVACTVEFYWTQWFRWRLIGKLKVVKMIMRSHRLILLVPESIRPRDISTSTGSVYTVPFQV